MNCGSRLIHMTFAGKFFPQRAQDWRFDGVGLSCLLMYMISDFYGLNTNDC